MFGSAQETARAANRAMGTRRMDMVFEMERKGAKAGRSLAVPLHIING